MNQINELYQKQINTFCDTNNKMTAQDILEKAKNIPQEEQSKSNIVKFNSQNIRSRIWKATLPVACFLFIGTTVLAASGYLGNLFKNIFKDETTAEIIEQGFVYEVQMTRTEDIFQANLLGVTGDKETPKLVFDIYVNDEAIAENNDTIRVLAYTLGVEQYENELDKYGPWEAYGIKDDEIPNLYHVSILGAPVWLTNGEEVVVDIWQINTDLGNDIWTTYELNMEYRFTIPESAFHPVDYAYYDNLIFSHEGIDYYLIRAEFGPYRSELCFEYDFEGSSLTGKEKDYKVLEDNLHENWLAFVSTVVLVVDGTEYTVNETEKGYTWCDEKGEVGKQNHCNAHPYFPSIDYENATSIIIKSGEISYTLK